jgi:hypothetical protein
LDDAKILAEGLISATDNVLAKSKAATTKIKEMTVKLSNMAENLIKAPPISYCDVALNGLLSAMPGANPQLRAKEGIWA